MSQSAAKQQPQPQGKKPQTAITPTRAEDFPGWYQAVIKAADLAENSPVRGCMTIKPYGYALWENMVRIFDGWLKDYGIQNCAFPLLIPVSFLAKEAEHVEGFAKECAVVTHHRLEADPSGKGLRPAPSAELEEPYVVRPTSETIIGDSMSRWVQSYRDLPLKLNQWCSVMRWEMRTRMFLRTSEFFWHEGHCAFADHEGAEKDCLTIQGMYEKFFLEYLAIPGIKGVKTPEERFPGANETYTIETLMQDGKALQAATSHDLGQNFAKSCNIKYQDKDGKEAFAHTTSWAFTSRMIGAMLMIHGDDDGMITPPHIAPQQVVVIPVLKGEGDAAVLAACDDLAAQVKAAGYRIHVDARDMRTPDKMWDSIKKGVPIRVEMGAREIAEGKLTHVRRDLGRESKKTEAAADFVKNLPGLVQAMHDDMLARARKFLESNLVEVSSLAEMRAHFADESKGGFVRIDTALTKDNPEFDAIKKDFAVTARCLPFADKGAKVIVGRAY
ncbi:MAG: proline--tRNA ligase [Rhodospirillales bacterium]|nr:proline--tRNA ligase [Alphaproteobacteria bacterium]MCB9987358.1 proline--tRNA ligase [Rhodospirillales bacterium]USO07793.1 MAG: proline--tRNA ligase [Rhodospirillales bacterium]